MSELVINNPEAEPFWQACADGRLRMQRCLECGEVFFFPRAFCPECSSDRLEWFDCSGHATLYSYTIVHRQTTPEIAAPYVLALVDLEEGPRMMSHIIDCPHDRLAVGMDLQVTFQGRIAGKPLPRFHPA
jgi:uncharacterized OB-fold protein